MSYALKYKMSFYDLYSQLNEVYFYERAYSGASENVTSLGTTPAIYEANAPSDDPYESVIKGSTCRFFLKDPTGFKYLDLFTADAKKFLVRWDVASAVWWTGWVAQDSYQQPYSVAPYGVEIICTDGLATLRNYDVSLTGKQSLMTVLAHCLGKIRVDGYAPFYLYENLTKYEINHDQTDADSPLTQTYADCDDFFYDEDGIAMNCYDAINKVFFDWGVMLRQSGGSWHLLQLNIMMSQYRRRKYTFLSGNYSYTTNELFDPVITTTPKQTIFTMNALTVGGAITMIPAWKKFTITQDYGKREQFFEDEEFEDWINPTTLRHWSKKSGLDYEKNGDKGVKLVPDTFGHWYIYQTISVEQASTLTQLMRLIIDYHTSCFTGKTGQMGFRIQANDGVNNYEWNDDYVNSYSDARKGWRNSIPPIWNNQSISEGDNSGKFERNITNPYFFPADLTIYVTVSWLGIMDYQGILYIDQVHVDCYENAYKYPEEYKHEVEINEDHNVTKDYQAAIGDAPLRNINDLDTQIHNSQLIWKNLYYVYVEGGLYIPTSKWDYKGGSNNQLLIQKLIAEIAAFRGTPKMLVASKMITKNLTPISIVQDQYNSNKKFMLHQGTYDAKYGTWELELMETVPEQSFLITEDGDYIITEAGGKIKI
jgi:hypothetical protein